MPTPSPNILTSDEGYKLYRPEPGEETEATFEVASRATSPRDFSDLMAHLGLPQGYDQLTKLSLTVEARREARGGSPLRPDLSARR